MESTYWCLFVCAGIKSLIRQQSMLEKFCSGTEHSTGELSVSECCILEWHIDTCVLEKNLLRK